MKNVRSKSLGPTGVLAIGVLAASMVTSASHAQGSVSLPRCDHDGTVSLDISTGSTNGTANAPGTVDPKWKLTAAPSGGPPAGNVYSRVPYLSYWASPPAPATWVTPWPNGQFVGNAVQGDYHYGLTFNVPPGYSSISVAGVCRADDEGTVSFNNVPTTSLPLCHFAGPIANFAFSGVVGSNVLDVKVHNGPGVINKSVTGDPTGLMVQATVTATCKVPPPPLGNHYLCYNTQRPWKGDVLLNDQFGTFRFRITAITRLCNPVEKQYNRTVSRIVDKRLHYVCYQGETKRVGRAAMVRNQFGSTILKVIGPTELCLPSDKTELGGGNPTGGDRSE